MRSFENRVVIKIFMKPFYCKHFISLQLFWTSIALSILIPTLIKGDDSWKVIENQMLTRWASEVNPDNVLPEYPRPMMVRKEWLNLNGLWDYAITGRDDALPQQFERKILVPYPIESALSGVNKSVLASDRLWYHRTFEIFEEWRGMHILLHFGAVDWETDVWVNKQYLGQHQGGYDPLSFDITEALHPSGLQQITVAVWDPTEKGHQPRGKQTREPYGFWYTAVTGIWQTVWVEPVPENYIVSLEIVPYIDDKTISVKVITELIDTKIQIKAVVKDKGKEIASAIGNGNELIVVAIKDVKHWSPDSPFLYDLEVSLISDEKLVDRVESYFGMRKISMKRDASGTLRIALNNEIQFQLGLLDQGWWPDGLYRAPTDEALMYDIKVAKDLGFNMLRKHIKVEPQRFYYWCDKLGMLVWQDMVSGDVTGEWGTDRSAQSARQFELELSNMISLLYNHPSIVTWVIFNEGWGQYDTKRLTEWVKKRDPSRLAVNASGFIDYGVGDIHAVHAYPGPTGAPKEKNRALVLGEFGGLGLPIKNHTWLEEKSWGYRSFKSNDQLTAAYENLLTKLHPYISQGLSGAIYTQITDVEREVNGLITYDRTVIKMDGKRVRTANTNLYKIEPRAFRFKPILEASQEQPQQWRYSFEVPDNEWTQPGFDDTSWSTGSSGFGNPEWVTPIIRTEWKTDKIWLRRSFNLESLYFDNPHVIIYHDFEQETMVYLNGELIAEGPEHQFAYTLIPLDKNTRKLFKKWANVLAVHCNKISKRQYVDVGLVDIINKNKN